MKKTTFFKTATLISAIAIFAFGGNKLGVVENFQEIFHFTSVSNDKLLDMIKVAKESAKKVQLQMLKVDLAESDENECSGPGNSTTCEIQSDGRNAVTVKVFLHNPDRARMTSARIFIAFDPTVLQGKSIDLTEGLPFDLVAPGELEFDQENGLAKIGVSTLGKVVDSERLEIATIEFSRKKDQFTTLDFFDPGEKGHTKILGIFNNFVVNLLDSPNVPALILYEN